MSRRNNQFNVRISALARAQLREIRDRRGLLSDRAALELAISYTASAMGVDPLKVSLTSEAPGILPQEGVETGPSCPVAKPENVHGAETTPQTHAIPGFCAQPAPTQGPPERLTATVDPATDLEEDVLAIRRAVAPRAPRWVRRSAGLDSESM